MKPQQEHREKLKFLSSLLAKIHKALMEFQMTQKELLARESFSSGMKLQLLIQDPEFQWLRILSQLMTLVDDAIFQKDPLTEEQYLDLLKEVKALMELESNKEFSGKYKSIAKKMASVQEDHARVIEFLQHQAPESVFAEN